jgi:hypothetical protein
MGFLLFTYDEVGDWHPNWSFIIVWSVLNVLPMWYVLYSNRNARPDQKRDADF